MTWPSVVAAFVVAGFFLLPGIAYLAGAVALRQSIEIRRGRGGYRLIASLRPGAVLRNAERLPGEGL